MNTVFDAERDIRRLAQNWRQSFGVPDKVRCVADFVPAPPLLKEHGNTPIFRGEPEIFHEPLSPSLFRKSFDSLDDLKTFELQQISSAYKHYSEIDVTDRFINAFAPLMHRDDLNWLFFARHIGKDTRLLDITRNPLVALYFASANTLDENGKPTARDGVVYFFQTQSYRPARKSHQNDLDQRDFPSLPISYRDLLGPGFDPNLKEDIPYLVFPYLPQERILAQQGGFFFWKNPKARLRDMRQLFPVIVDASAKSDIRRELESFGISEDSMFPS